MKKGGGRRYYRPEDIALLSGIRALLYDDGLSIKKVQTEIKAQGISSISTRGRQPITAQGGIENVDAAETHANPHIDDDSVAVRVETEDEAEGEYVPNIPDDQGESRDRLTGALQKLLNARERLNDTLQKH
jgi:DNA-binding transcriptional MerR regulator